MTKKVNLNLLELDGNALMLIGAFRVQAKKEGWTPDEITVITEKCMTGDYDNLLRTLMEVCEPTDE